MKLKYWPPLLICSIINSFSIFAQQGFTRKYSNPTKRVVPYSVSNSGDSALFLAGSFVVSGVPLNELLLLKTDTLGQVIWNTNLTIAPYARWNKVFVASANAIYCCGVNDSLTPAGDHYANGYVARFDGAGNLQWCLKVNLLDATEPKFISQLSNGDLIIGGSTSPYYFEIPHGFIFRISPSGIIYWSKTFTFYNNEPFYLRDLYVDSADNIVLTGVYSYPLLQSDSFFAKMDAFGNFIWQKIFVHQTGYERSLSVTGTGNEYFFTALRSDSTGAIPNSLLLKTDIAGNIQFAKTYTTPLQNLPWIYTNINSNGEILMQMLWYHDTHCLRIDTTGNVLCSKWAVYPSPYMFSSSCIFKNSQIALTGYTYSIQNPALLSVSDYDSCNLACYESLFTSNVDSPVYTDSAVTFIVSSAYSSSLVTPVINFNQVTDSIVCIAITGIQDNAANNNPAFLIFPNPFTSEISITIQKLNFKQAAFTIKNILGQTVFNMQGNNFNNAYTKTIDLNFLSKGIYLLDTDIDGERIVKKIVKE